MLTTLPAWLAMLATVGALEQARLNQLIEASARLEPGDDEAKVLSALGPPLERWPKRDAVNAFLFGDRPRQWVYGTVLDIEEIFAYQSAIPILFPLKLRLFSPDEDDLVINWSDDGQIASVVHPKWR
jgi:hypothetical protein